MGWRIFTVSIALCAWLGGAAAQEKATIFPQLGHFSDVSSIAYSPDGKLLASGSWDKSIRIWDIASGRLERTLRGHSKDVECVVFSPNGRMLASVGSDQKIILWDMATGQAAHVISSGNNNWGWAIAFSPGGDMLAAGIGDDLVVLDTASGNELGRVPAVHGMVSAIAFSPDGRLLALAGNNTLKAGLHDHGIKLWDLEHIKEIRDLEGHTDDIYSLSFSPNGRTLASGSGDKTVRLWDVASGVSRAVLSGHTKRVSSVAFSPDGKILASASFDRTLKLWDVAKRREIRTLASRKMAVACVAFSPDGATLASGFFDGTINLFDIASGREHASLIGHSLLISHISYSRDGKMLASAGDNNAITLWDLSTGTPLRILSADGVKVTDFVFSPVEDALASVSRSDPMITLWDGATGSVSRTITGDAPYSEIVFAPDGKELAVSSGANIEVWDIPSGKKTHSFKAECAEETAGDKSLCSVWSLAFAPNGKTLASNNADTCSIWDAATGALLHTLCNDNTGIFAVTFSPDGKYLASANMDNTTQIWDAGRGALVRKLLGHSDAVLAVSFSPDGKQLASTSFDDTVKVWDVASGDNTQTLSALPDSLLAIAYSPNGKVLATGGSDVKLWNPSSSRIEASLASFDDGSSIAVTPEGYFVSSSAPAEDYLNVFIADRVFGISSFRGNFYRPDLVKRALAGEALTQFGSIGDVKLSPVVELAGLPSAVTDSKLTMTLHLTNGGGGFGPVRVFWNGTVIQQDSDLPETGSNFSRSYSVPLSNGDNSLRATASNADGTMWSDARASVTANLPPVAKDASAHGTLHAIVVGIQEFPNAPNNNLSYPEADARLIAKTLTEKAGPLFDKLDVRLLTTAALTDRAHLIDALKAVQADAGPNDEFVFYVASHGIVVAGQYYLITSNVTAADSASLAASALSAKDLSALLANIHAAKKLVILDTCDAGAASASLKAGDASSGLNAHDATTILAREFGLTVLAATESDQEALEGGYQNHGLFTYVVADGLSGKAADKATGIVNTALLAKHVRDQVPLLAETVLHRVQTPTVENSGRTFPITKVK